VNHGYVRTRDGDITKYDVSGAGTGSGQGTLGGCINPAGTIAGDYLDANNVFHGYLRFANGSVTPIDDVPGAGTGPLQGTFPFCNNPRDAITGYYIDASNVKHGFLLSPCSQGDADCQYTDSAAQGEAAPATQPPSTEVPVNPAFRDRFPRPRRGPAN